MVSLSNHHPIRALRHSSGRTDALIRLALPVVLSLPLVLCPVPELLATTWVYTANESGGSVPVIDADAGKKRATIRGLRAPHNIHLGPDGMLYVTDGPANQAVKVDPDKLRILARWEVGRGPAHIFMTPDQQFIVNTNTESGDVTITDASTLQPLATIPVGKSPHGIAIAPDGKYLISCDQESAQLSIYDAATDTLVKQLPLGTWTHGISFSPDSKYAFVTNTKSDDISVVDLRSMTEVKRIKVGKGPNGIAASYPNSPIKKP